MNQVIKKDVEGVVIPADGAGTVVIPGEGGDDKNKNFAELRKQVAEKDAEIARLTALAGGNGGAVEEAFDLSELPDDKKGGDAGALQKVFKRDMKEAILQWTAVNKVTPAQWAIIKKNVRLNGEETLTEIKNAITQAHSNLPDVREAHEKGLIEKGKKIAMEEHFDDEVSIPGGGSGGSGGEGGGAGVRVPKETRDWGRKLGLSDKEIESVDPEGDSNAYTILDPQYK